MKSLGMARKIDQLGRVVLPAELRRLFNIGEGDLVEIYVEDDRIILRKVEDHCVFCGATEALQEHRHKQICKTCIDDLK